MRSTTIRGREVYYFETRFFEVDGKRFEIVGTGDIKGETVHRIKGATETKEIKHKTLVNLFKSGKLRSVMP